MAGFFNSPKTILVDRISNMSKMNKITIGQTTATFNIHREVDEKEYLLVYLQGLLLNEGVEFSVNGTTVDISELKAGDVIQYAYVTVE